MERNRVKPIQFRIGVSDVLERIESGAKRTHSRTRASEGTVCTLDAN
jgi:hypothetical protein